MTELPEDIRAAIERCKAFQVERDSSKPGASEPAAFYIVACDEHIIMMPPTIVDADRLTRMITSQEKKDILGYVKTYFNCTVFWIRGQTGEGVSAAVERAKTLRDSGWAKIDLYTDASNALQEAIAQTKADMAVTPPSAKKY